MGMVSTLRSGPGFRFLLITSNLFDDLNVTDTNSKNVLVQCLCLLDKGQGKGRVKHLQITKFRVF